MLLLLNVLLIQVHAVVNLILGIGGKRSLRWHQIVFLLLNLNLLRLLVLNLIQIWFVFRSIDDLLLLVSHHQPNLWS